MTSHPPVPPRPSRSQEPAPKIPPRPNRRLDRSVSPNPDRFAPSPLAAAPFPPKNDRSHLAVDPIERPQSVEMPSVGEEGREYEALEDEGPEHTHHTVGADIKLFAPKPSLPAQSAKQRLATVTRTDSDKAASFGIGRPAQEHEKDSSMDPKNRGSSASQTSAADDVEDEHGIPEIGQQVPMYPDAGDVQAPSHTPLSDDGRQSKNHQRKGSNLPPGSYGLHGHGVTPRDSLGRAYYEKHPELLKKEHTPHHYDRPNDFSMSSEALDKIVHEGGPTAHYEGTPSEQVGWQAIEKAPHAESPEPDAEATPPEVIHVEDGRTSVEVADEPEDYSAPILAEDEVRKHPPHHDHPAIDPLPEHRGSFEAEPASRPLSRVESQRESLHKVSSEQPTVAVTGDDSSSSPSDYEPLKFPDKTSSAPPAAADPKLRALQAHEHRFPSRDVWEDAPESAYYTTSVSTPELAEQAARAGKEKAASPPPRDETPAQAFARRQEELAEREARENGPDSFLYPRAAEKPVWAQHQGPARVAPTEKARGETRRFPSRDVWEDAPDSLRLETTVSTPQQDEPESAVSDKPSVPQRPTRKPTDPERKPSDPSSERPAVPQRPKPRTTSSSDGRGASPSAKPAISDRPKPHVPTRPVKTGSGSSGRSEPADAPSKPKPAVPARPAGSKIAALQAGFMSDLNKKLGLGPRGPKEAAEEESVPEAPKEKAPLSDARKGRARGPQRRAPAAKSVSPAGAATEDRQKQPVLVSAQPLFEIDPDDGEVSVGGVEEGPKEKGLEGTEGEGEGVKSMEAKAEEKEDKEKKDKEKEDKEEKDKEEKEEDKEEKDKEEKEEEEERQTLATNMAGEPVVESVKDEVEEH